MKKFTFSTFNKVLFSLFAVSTILLIFFVFNNVDNKFVLKFGMAYIFFVFAFIIYVPIVVIWKLRKLKWTSIKRRLFIFIGVFIFLFISGYIRDLLLKSSDISLWNGMDTKFGLSFGVAFIDMLFNKPENENIKL